MLVDGEREVNADEAAVVPIRHICTAGGQAGGKAGGEGERMEAGRAERACVRGLSLAPKAAID